MIMQNRKSVGLFIDDKVGVAPDAIILNNPGAGFFDEDDLRFGPQGKYGCMSHTVFGLEIVSVQHIIVGNMAIVAGGIFPVCTVKPGGILWCHDVAVDAGFGVIGKVGRGIGQVQQIKE